MSWKIENSDTSITASYKSGKLKYVIVIKDDGSGESNVTWSENSIANFPQDIEFDSGDFNEEFVLDVAADIALEVLTFVQKISSEAVSSVKNRFIIVSEYGNEYLFESDNKYVMYSQMIITENDSGEEIVIKANHPEVFIYNLYSFIPFLQFYKPNKKKFNHDVEEGDIFDSEEIAEKIEIEIVKIFEQKLKSFIKKFKRASKV